MEKETETGKRIKNQGKEAKGKQQCSLQCDLRLWSVLEIKVEAWPQGQRMNLFPRN